MDTILHEYKLIQNIQEEYNKLINFYENTRRSSILIAYYNINTENTSHEEDLYSTYDNYNVSNIRFDLFDYTPVYNISEVNNQSTENEEMDGIGFEGNTTITVYTIRRPKINDLVRFYKPIKSGEIFRVRDFSVSTSSLHSDPSVGWFQLELDYAPIETTEFLNVLNHYIYNFSEQKYIEYSKYIEYIKNISSIQNVLNNIMKFYVKKYDLYKVGNHVPIFVNEIIAILKRSHSENYRRIFEKFYLPYGYLNLFNFDFYYGSLDLIPRNDINSNIFKIYDLENKKIFNYNWDLNFGYSQDTLEELINYGIELLKLIDNTSII
ncbi:MAG: hypothetical protein ACOC22_01990 [bacterium]